MFYGGGVGVMQRLTGIKDWYCFLWDLFGGREVAPNDLLIFGKEQRMARARWSVLFGAFLRQVRRDV